MSQPLRILLGKIKKRKGLRKPRELLSRERKTRKRPERSLSVRPRRPGSRLRKMLRNGLRTHSWVRRILTMTSMTQKLSLCRPTMPNLPHLLLRKPLDCLTAEVRRAVEARARKEIRRTRIRRRKRARRVARRAAVTMKAP